MDSTGTTTDTGTPAIAYKPKRRAGQATTRAARTTKPAPTRRPVKLMIDADAYEAAMITSLREGRTLSEIASSALRTTCDKFVVYARTKGEATG